MIVVGVAWRGVPDRIGDPRCSALEQLGDDEGDHVAAVCSARQVDAAVVPEPVGPRPPHPRRNHQRVPVRE